MLSRQSDSRELVPAARMLWTCMTPGCEVVGHFTVEPGFCSICLRDMTGVYDTTATLVAEEDK